MLRDFDSSRYRHFSNPHILNEDEKDKFGAVFNTKDVGKINKMITGLMRTYIDIGAVEVCFAILLICLNLRGS